MKFDNTEFCCSPGAEYFRDCDTDDSQAPRKRSSSNSTMTSRGSEVEYPDGSGTGIGTGTGSGSGTGTVTGSASTTDCTYSCTGTNYMFEHIFDGRVMGATRYKQFSLTCDERFNYWRGYPESERNSFVSEIIPPCRGWQDF